jgi:hypothetical protein
MHRLVLCLVLSAALVLPAAAVAQGGGKFTPSLPPDFPSAVALPAGTLTGSTGSSPSWSIGLLIDGAYPDVMSSVHDFYVARGYSEVGPTWMYRLTNGAYTVAFVGRNHDHSATRTDVTIQVTAS